MIGYPLPTHLYCHQQDVSTEYDSLTPQVTAYFESPGPGPGPGPGDDLAGKGCEGIWWVGD